MKILLDGRLISNKPTGISRYSREMVKIYQDYYGYENVEVIVNEDLDDKTFKIIKTKLKPFNIKHFFLFHNFLKKTKADVYHTLYYSNSFFKNKEKVYITTVHDLMYSVVPSFFSKNRIKNLFCKVYFDLILKKTLKNSDIIISVSKTTKQDLYTKFGYDSIFIVEGLNIVSTQEKVIPEMEGKEYFLYVGNSRPHKNLEFLIECYEESQTKKELVLVGTGNKISTKNLKIKCLGYVSDDELKWLYKNSSAFIFPSIYEGFGLPILEALDNKCKVFSSTGGALKEFPKEVVNYFDPSHKEELIKLIKNVDSVRINEEVLKNVLEKYTWKNTQKYMFDIFDEKLKSMVSGK